MSEYFYKLFKFKKILYLLNLLNLNFFFYSIIFAVPVALNLTDSNNQLTKQEKLVKLKTNQTNINNCVEVVIKDQDRFSLNLKLQKKSCLMSDKTANAYYQKFILQEDSTIRAYAWNYTDGIIKKYREQPQCLTIAHAKITELQRINLEDCASREEQKFTIQKSQISPIKNQNLCLGFDLLEEELALRDCATYNYKLTVHG